MENVLEIKNLNYKKNQRTILSEINLSLKPGKIIALLGENGAGKTTLMRVIAGVAKNYRGLVNVSGEAKDFKRKAHLSFTESLNGFSGSLKIDQVINLYEHLYDDFDREQFEQLFKFMRLSKNQRLSQLSKGMREKLVIALTFSRKVDLYLLDEPFSGIDSMARKQIINSLIRWKDEKATVLISDHFVNEITAILDEVVVIKNKTILTHQSAEAIREKNESIEDFYESLYQMEEE